MARKNVRHDTAGNVGRAARGERHDHCHRARQVALGLRGAVNRESAAMVPIFASCPPLCRPRLNGASTPRATRRYELKLLSHSPRLQFASQICARRHPSGRCNISGSVLCRTDGCEDRVFLQPDPVPAPRSSQPNSGAIGASFSRQARYGKALRNKLICLARKR